MGNSPYSYRFSETHGKQIMRIYYHKNIVYTGEYMKHTKHGFGIEYYKNKKTKYFGYFYNDKYHGQGILYDKKGNIIYNGNFKRGKPLSQYCKYNYIPLL